MAAPRTTNAATDASAVAATPHHDARGAATGMGTAAATATNAAQGMPIAQTLDTTPRTLGFAHVLLQVRDLDASRRFYVDLLGFTVRPAKPLADGRPFLPFQQGIALTSGGPGAPLQIDHIAFTVHDVAALADRLRDNGVRFFQDLHDGIYGRTIYVADPDGTKVELYETP
ncbi:MAG: VOC family protein [Proteobacteria bacterium]|nr:VOC family protein [Burkholderiales bacterium]